MNLNDYANLHVSIYKHKHSDVKCLLKCDGRFLDEVFIDAFS